MKITYKQVQNEVAHNIEQKNRKNPKSTESIRRTIQVYTSASNKFIQEGLQQTIEDIVDDTYFSKENFEAALNMIAKDIWSSTTIKAMKTKVRYFYRTYISMQEDLQIKDLPIQFGQRLRYYITLRKVSQLKLSHESGISANAIKKWAQNITMPQIKSLASIEILEQVLNCKGKLIETLPIMGLIGADKLRQLKRQTEEDHARKVFYKIAKYGLQLKDFPPKLHEEFEHFFRFHTMNNVPLGKTRGNKYWKRKATQLLNTQIVVSFFGFCVLKKDAPEPWMRGLGIRKEKLTLAMMTDAEKWTKYKEFHYERTKYAATRSDNGTYQIYENSEPYNSSAVKATISRVQGFINPVDGYFTQHGELYQRLIKTRSYINENSNVSWAEWCAQCFRELDKLRSPKETWVYADKKRDQVKQLLTGENKRKILKVYLPKVIQNFKKLLPLDPKKQLTNRQIIVARRYMLFALIIANPMRARNIREMRIGIDIINRYGFWYWNMASELFKAEKWDKDDMYAPVPEFAAEALDYYLMYARPHSLGGKIKKEWREKYVKNKFWHEDGTPVMENINGKKQPIAETLVLVRHSICAKNRYKITDEHLFSNEALRQDIMSASSMLEETGFFGWTTHLTRLIISSGIQAEEDGNTKKAALVLRDTIHTVDKHYSPNLKNDALEDHGKKLNAYVNNEEYISNNDSETTQRLKNEKSDLHKQILGLKENIEGLEQQLIKQLTIIRELQKKLAEKELVIEQSNKKFEKIKKEGGTAKNKILSEMMARIQKLEATKHSKI